MIAKAKAKRYVENDGSYCPYCDSAAIVYIGRFDVSMMRVQCDTCGKDWYEIFKLVGIGDKDGEIITDE